MPEVLPRSLLFGKSSRYTAFGMASSNEGIEFLAHHQFQDCAHRALSQDSQMLVEFLLVWQKWF
jgi:hypothetical protein